MAKKALRIFKNKLFAKWSNKELISDSLLISAIEELRKALIDGRPRRKYFKETPSYRK